MSTVMLTLVLAIVFGTVVLLVLAVASLTEGKVDMRERLSTKGPTAIVAATPTRLVIDDSRTLWAKLVQEVERRGVSLKDSKSDVLAEKLMLAGYNQPYAVRAFVLIKTLLTIGLPLFALLFMYLTGLPSVAKLYMTGCAAAAIGLYMPNFVISSKASQRKKEILNGFPDTLDLMLVCVEAGLGIDACFARVGSEITKSHPLLAELLATVSLELRAGRARELALRGFARRTALPELIAFVTLLNQSAKLGTSVGQALKVYSAEMREGRRMRAEEKAAKLPVLLSIPLVLLLLPTMMAVLLLPAAINIRHNLGSVPSGNK